MIPVSLYVHLPWCLKKCPYCDFNSHEIKKESDKQQYIAALLQDLDNDREQIKKRKISSIFIGGGTPSLFTANQINQLLQGINSLVEVEEGAEITMEVNPGSLERKYLSDYLSVGVNRLSLGVQSFQDDKLKILGRVHDSKDVHIALKELNQIGFKKFNVDLMFGLPKQQTEDALFDLRSAIEYDPQHLSWYQLTLEPNTYFYHKPPKLPDDESIWDLQQIGSEFLQKNGFLQYEVSAFAKQESEKCKHNLNYWQFGDYLGIGAGAHSKVTDLSTGKVYRSSKVKHPKHYERSFLQRASFLAKHDEVNKEKLAFEFMLNALRLYQPIVEGLLFARTGLNFFDIKDQLTIAINKGLIKKDRNFVYTTDLGKRFLNELLQIFL